MSSAAKMKHKTISLHSQGAKDLDRLVKATGLTSTELIRRAVDQFTQVELLKINAKTSTTTEV